MKKVNALFLSFLILFPLQAFSDTPQVEIEAFFDGLATNKVSVSVKKLFASNALASEKQQQLKFMTQQINSIAQLYGKLIGRELVTNDELSPSLTRLVYLAKYELHPVVWEFYFYKPKDKWVISNAVFGDQFQYLGSKK